MKKKLITLMLVLSCVGLVGCGREEEAEPEATEVVENISVERNTEIPNIVQMAKEDILAMTAEEVQASVEEYLPSYRRTYKIADDRVMSTEDWLQLRDIICIQMYGSLLDGKPAEVEDVFGDDPDAIYYAPTVESIEEMDLQNFAVYLNNMYTYYYGEDWLRENQMDFTVQSDEVLAAQKEELIKTLRGQQDQGGQTTNDTEAATNVE